MVAALQLDMARAGQVATEVAPALRGDRAVPVAVQHETRHRDARYVGAHIDGLQHPEDGPRRTGARAAPFPTVLVLYLGPVYAAFTAWLLLGDPPTWYHFAGAALILPSIRLATRRQGLSGHHRPRGQPHTQCRAAACDHRAVNRRLLTAAATSPASAIPMLEGSDTTAMPITWKLVDDCICRIEVPKSPQASDGPLPGSLIGLVPFVKPLELSSSQ